MKTPASILVLFFAALMAAKGQNPAHPAQRSASVTVNGSGTVVAPANFWGGLTDAQLDMLAARIEARRCYPVFLIPLGGPYVDFVIKASTDNFLEEIRYWFASASTVSMRQHPVFDTAPAYFFTAGDTERSWRRGESSVSLYQQVGPGRAVNTVVFTPSKIAGSAGWMFQGNARLTWVYARVSAVDFERDGSGDVVWNPILPVEWRQEPPEPVETLP